MEWEESQGERLICPARPYGPSGLFRFPLWVYDLGPPPGMRGGHCLLLIAEPVLSPLTICSQVMPTQHKADVKKVSGKKKKKIKQQENCCGKMRKVFSTFIIQNFLHKEHVLVHF